MKPRHYYWMVLQLAQDADADALLSSDPLALLIGMVLDQQIPLEKAFAGPLVLTQRLGRGLDARDLADMDPERLVALFCERPALHRFPAANARRVADLCRVVADEYGGRAADIWETAPDGVELLRRIKALPGFGEQKARIFIGLLGKQLRVRPSGWRDAAGAFGRDGTYMSVADIVDRDSLGEVRRYKQDLKAQTKARAAAEA